MHLITQFHLDWSRAARHKPAVESGPGSDRHLTKHAPDTMALDDEPERAACVELRELKVARVAPTVGSPPSDRG